MREAVLIDRPSHRCRHSGVLFFGEVNRRHRLVVVERMARATTPDALRGMPDCLD
jgi:hypothetical protein